MWFIGVEVEQETSTLPAKKNPGSASGLYQKDLYRNDPIPSEYSKSVKDTNESGKTSKLYNLQGQGFGLLVLAPGVGELYLPLPTTLQRKKACLTDGTKLLKNFVCKTAPKSLFWVPTCLPGFEYAPLHD